jgi:hypothetical protein
MSKDHARIVLPCANRSCSLSLVTPWFYLVNIDERPRTKLVARMNLDSNEVITMHTSLAKHGLTASCG